MSKACPVCMSQIASDMGTCPSCGFKLLGSTQEFHPIVLDDQLAAPSETASSTVSLKIVRGPQKGLAYTLTEDEYDVGRSPHSAIFLNDMTVSRLHAYIRREGSSYVVRDNNSYNGVWVNNENVESKVLEHGDFIQIGTFCLRYEEAK